MSSKTESNSAAAKKAESKKSTAQLFLGLSFLLVYATATQMQADSSEHAAQVVQAHLAVGDAYADQEAFAQHADKSKNSKSVLKTTRHDFNHDFNQDASKRLAASVQLGSQSSEKADVEEMEIQSGAFKAELAQSLNNMDENIDAMITDMLSLQHEVSLSMSRQPADTALKTERTKNLALSEALSALIRQASEQKTQASNAGNFQSFASAEQKVIRLHAQAARLASIRD